MAGKFSLDISAFVAKAKGNGRAVVRKVVLDVDTSVVLKTPVGDPDNWKQEAPPGYVGGRARGSWQYAKGAPSSDDDGTIDGRDPKHGDPSAHSVTARVALGVNAGDPATTHFLTSTVPYMRRLEYEGWSRQAPDGMVRRTVEEYKTFVKSAVGDLK